MKRSNLIKENSWKKVSLLKIDEIVDVFVDETMEIQLELSYSIKMCKLKLFHDTWKSAIVNSYIEKRPGPFKKNGGEKQTPIPKLCCESQFVMFFPFYRCAEMKCVRPLDTAYSVWSHTLSHTFVNCSCFQLVHPITH